MSDGPLTPNPTIFVLYGATGDLAHRLVLPAIFQLAIAGLLPTDWRLIGNGRGDLSDEDFQERVRQSLEEFRAEAIGGALGRGESSAALRRRRIQQFRSRDPARHREAG